MNAKKADNLFETEGDKILVSFYLSPQTLEDIDDLLFLIKKKMPIEKRRKLTKSVFYETGMKFLIESYRANGEENSFVKKVLELMQD